MKKLIFVLAALLPLSLAAQVVFQSSNLPIVFLETNGEPIPDEPKINAWMKVVDKGLGQINQVSDPPDHFDGRIGIELRGSTSNFLSDKKPYSVEIRDAEGEDLDFPLLGMPAESDWAFIAPFNDKSLIREALMFNLAREVMPWASRCRFVELVLNGEYQGIYMVTEKIKRGKDRVNIARLKPDDLTGDALTGGYILKLDKTSGAPNEGWISPYPHVPGAWQTTLWQIEYPKIGDVQPGQKAYIQQWITEFETVMNSPDFADPENGYPKYLDVRSFLDFTLLNEMAKCVDAYRISTFLWKDRDDRDPRLHAGPVWDFNIALGNAGYCTAQSTAGWIIDFNQHCPDDSWIIQFWWKKMWDDPAYRAQLKARWLELRAGPLSNANIFHKLDSLTQTVQEAQVRNFERWPILYDWVWPNVFCCGPFDQHTAFLRNWLQARLFWMDNALKTLAEEELALSPAPACAIFPNPVSAGQPVRFQCPARSGETQYLSLRNVLGQTVLELSRPPASDGGTWEWSPEGLRPGTYFYEIREAGQRAYAGRLVLSR
jgi:CotH protein.